MKFSVHVTVADARSSAVNNAICYVLQVSRMTLFAHNGLYDAWLRGHIVKVIHQGAELRSKS